MANVHGGAPPTPMDYFWAAPPFTRTITALCILESLIVKVGLVNVYKVLFHHSFLVQFPPQIWRLFTSFLLAGDGLGIIFDPYFLYMYCSKLETSSPRLSRRPDFYTYVIFVWATILAVNYAFVGGFIFTQALMLAFTYTACQDDRLSKASFFFVTIPSPWVPWAMLLMTFLMSGPQQALVQGSGLVAAHLHFFLTDVWPSYGGGRNYLQTPAIIENLVGTTIPRIMHRAYGTAFQPATQRPGAGGSTSQASSSVLPESWRSRGTGHRLGGD